jgi:signal peptidase I
MLKRVIAVAGDQISITLDGTVYLNGVAINEEYLTIAASSGGDVSYALTIPEGKVFVIGDYRGDCIDRRDSVLGMVSSSEIVGTVEARVWPVERAGSL